MPLPLIGSATGRILDAAEVSIHGDLYLDATLELEPAPGVLALSGSAVRVRIPKHACAGGRFPQAGDRVRVEVLMGQVTGVVLMGGDGGEAGVTGHQ